MLIKVKIFWKLSLLFILMTLFVLIGMEYLSDYLESLYHPENSDSIITYQFIKYLSAIIIVVVLYSIATWLFLKWNVHGPIKNLVYGMNKLAEKEFGFQLDEDESDEFGSLAQSFNDMSAMLSSSLRELQKNKDYLGSVLESSADIIITVNAADKIQTINSGAEGALGYNRLELIGKPIEKLFADPKERKAAINKLQFKDSVVNFETQFMTKGNETRDVLLTLSRLRNPRGEIIGTIGISKDITEEKRLQNQLIQSQRYAAIGQVFTGIQHSMKNMLNACKGGSYMVRTGLKTDNQKMLEDGWDIVQEGIQRLTDMSLNMLKYVKEWRPRFGEAKINQILSEIYRLMKQTAGDKGVEFSLNLSDDLPTVVCDHRMIHSSIMDIASNALDACLWKEYNKNEIPQVTLGANMNSGNKNVYITIQDNGCGMDEEVKENIFNPFFSTKSKAGTGLGLSITSRMIEVHGGKIKVESEPNIGTTFKIILPVKGINKKEEAHG